MQSSFPDCAPSYRWVWPRFYPLLICCCSIKIICNYIRSQSADFSCLFYLTVLSFIFSSAVSHKVHDFTSPVNILMARRVQIPTVSADDGQFFSSHFDPYIIFVIIISSSPPPSSATSLRCSFPQQAQQTLPLRESRLRLVHAPYFKTDFQFR